MGGPNVSAPALSPEERELIAQQTALLGQAGDILEQYQTEVELMQPILYEQAGIRPVYNEEGELTGFEEIPDELEPMREELEQRYLERSLAAVRGELPVSPGLMRELSDAEGILRESLRKSLGPDYEASTAGSRSLGEFFERRENILESARRGDLTMAESLSLAREEAGRIGRTGNISTALGIPGARIGAVPAMGGVAGGFGGPLSTLAGQRQMQFQADVQSSQAFSSGLAGLGALAGTLGAAAIFASSEKLKEGMKEIDTRDVVEKLADLPIYKWRYKGDDATHIGPMAERFSDAFGVGDGKTIHMADVAGVFLSVAKEMAKKVA